MSAFRATTVAALSAAVAAIAPAAAGAATLEEAFDATLKTSGTQDPSMITIITGPSRTADIEKTLVLGAHGPCRLVVILVREL